MVLTGNEPDPAQCLHLGTAEHRMLATFAVDLKYVYFIDVHFLHDLFQGNCDNSLGNFFITKAMILRSCLFLRHYNGTTNPTWSCFG